MVDPSGHDGRPPAGNQIELNIALGLNVKSLFLAYYSLNLVTDNRGGVQLYFTKRDQDFNAGKGFEAGPAERANPTSLFAFGGASVTWGAMDGSDVRNRGTLAFEGNAVNADLSVGPYAVQTYAYTNPETGVIDPSMLTGTNAGYSWGGPLTYGTITTSSISLTPRFQLPDWAIPICHVVGQCGSGEPLNNPVTKPPKQPITSPKIETPVITPLQKYPKLLPK